MRSRRTARESARAGGWRGQHEIGRRSLGEQVIHPVLVRLRALGIRVSADGSKLGVAPRSAITNEVRQPVRSHKVELLTVLEAETRLRQLAAELDLPVDDLLRCYRDYVADIARLPANDLRGLIRGFATFRDYCRRAMARVH